MHPGGDVEVRPVRPEEFEEAGRVTALAYSQYLPARDAPEFDDWHGYLGEIANIAGRAGRTLVVVASDPAGHILGSATLELTEPLGDDDQELEPGAAHVRMLGVDPGARGRGVGRALMDACIERARRDGKRWVTLRTTGRMTEAQRLYASLGFVRDPDHDLRPEPDFHLIAYRLTL